MANYTKIEGNHHQRTAIYKYGEYLYSRNSKRLDKIYLKCQMNVSRRGICPGTALLDVQSDEMKAGRSHNHSPEDYSLELDLVKQVKKACEMNLTNERRSEVFRNTVRGHPDAGKISFGSLESTLYRAGRKSQPRLPTTPTELATALQTANNYNQNFREVITDTNGDTGLIFFSNKIFTLLPIMRHVSFDGTFFVTPKLFTQLFTLHSVINSQSFPLIYVLMTSKSQDLYMTVTSTLKSTFPALQPHSMMGDYELAARNSMQSAFPTATLSGCQFHFSQALWRKLQKLNLTQLYKQNLTVKKHVKMLMSLPYLPSDLITQNAETLFSQQIDVSPQQRSLLQKFHAYIRRYWLQTITPQNLSVYELERGTNNDCESFHSRLKAKIKTHRPNPWAFLGHLNNLIEDMDLDIERHFHGLQLSRPKAKTSIQNIERRNNLKQKLANDLITPINYLAAISHTFNNAISVQVDSDDSSDESEPEEAPENARNSCPVCLQPREDTYVLVPCFHAFCNACSLRFPPGSQCPVCRAATTGRQQVYL